MQQKQKDFAEYIRNLEAVIRDESIQARLKDLVTQAKLLEGEAQFEKAIKLYEQILKEGATVTVPKEYSEHLAQLKKDWTIKNEAHGRARAFIYEKWSKPEAAAQLKAELPEAQHALQTFKAVGDALTPRMLLIANISHAARLEKRLKEALRSTNPSERAEGKTIVEVNEGLQKLTDETREYLKSAQPAKMP